MKQGINEANKKKRNEIKNEKYKMKKAPNKG